MALELEADPGEYSLVIWCTHSKESQHRTEQSSSCYAVFHWACELVTRVVVMGAVDRITETFSVNWFVD